ncbi:MAG: fibronectin type III domain-containing protein [Candidatus Nanopelagicales bacterium]
MGMFRRRTSGADGATAVEYAIILGGTVFGLVAIVVGLKTTMGNALSDASDSQAVLSDGSTATPSNGPTSVVLPPAAPSVSAAPGNGQTAITWAPVSGATSYVVTCNGNSVTVTTTGYTCTGLTNGQSYTVTVVAKGSSGTSAPGSATVTPFTTPNAPTNVTADTNDGAITIRWTAPANNGGSPITGYTVTPNPATGGSCTVAGTTATCTGLTDGTSTTFTVVANNAGGSSPTASPGLPVRPYDVGTNQAEVDFGTPLTRTPTYSQNNNRRNYSVGTVSPTGCGTATVSSNGAITFTPVASASATCLAGTAVNVTINYRSGNGGGTARSDTFVFYVH